MSHSSDSHFGASFWLQSAPLFCGYLAIGAFCVSLNEILNHVDEVTKDSSYQHIVQRIYRELMVTGVTAFTWICIEEVGDLPAHSDWVGALRFADITAFTTALFFCIQGCCIMLISLWENDSWYKKFRRSIISPLLKYDINVCIGKKHQKLKRLRLFMN